MVEVVAGDIPKEQWLMARIAEFIDKGDVLIFANQKTRVDMLCDKLKAAGIRSPDSANAAVLLTAPQQLISSQHFNCARLTQ